jgi:hypothetical protein
MKHLGEEFSESSSNPKPYHRTISIPTSILPSLRGRIILGNLHGLRVMPGHGGLV